MPRKWSPRQARRDLLRPGSGISSCSCHVPDSAVDAWVYPELAAVGGDALPDRGIPGGGGIPPELLRRLLRERGLKPSDEPDPGYIMPSDPSTGYEPAETRLDLPLLPNGSIEAAGDGRVDEARSALDEGISISEGPGTTFASHLETQRQEAVAAAREALDIAERDAKKLQLLKANSAKAAVSASQLRQLLRQLGEWSLWERLLRDPELGANIEAWQAASDFARIIRAMQPKEVDVGSLGPLLDAITHLRQQIDFVEQHASSGGWLEFLEIYLSAAHRIRWKIAVALAAAMADMGASGTPLTAKIMLAALTGAGAGSLTAAALEEIRDRASVRSMERTPRGRMCKAQEELIGSIDVLISLLGRREQNVEPEEGELEVTRTAQLVAEFRAINLGQEIAEFNLVKPHTEFPEIRSLLYSHAFKRTRSLLADVLDMTISEDYTRADRIIARISQAVDGLKQNTPCRN
jgi:hypothetical protein